MFQNNLSFEDRVESAKREAWTQVKNGLIQGCVFAVGTDGPAFALGTQTVHPVPRPMTPESRFDIASTGKTFTAGCCALLVADGLLDPDAPFTHYLPEHVLGKNCDITVRDLAMHISGFDNSKPYDSPDPAVFEYELFHKKPVRKRLEAFEYSCSNFILLGKIVERISGLRLDEFARTRIWAPLGMMRTQWTAPGPGPDEVEHWFPNRPAGEHNDSVCFQCPYPIGSGSCFSTAGDMRLFVRDIVTRTCFPSVYYDLITRCGFEKNGARRSFGWDMCEAHRPRNLSPRTVFHSGWTGQSICADPESGFSAVVLTSRTGDWDAAYAGRVRIIERLYGEKR